MRLWGWLKTLLAGCFLHILIVPVGRTSTSMQPNKPLASLSLDLDNKWSYMKTHGDRGWETFPSYLGKLVPRLLQCLAEHKLYITVFVVGQDAALIRNREALKMIANAGHEIGNHS